MKTPPRVLAVSSISDMELEKPIHKKSCQEDESIDFTGKYLRDTIQPHEDALVVTLQIWGFDVKRVMIDQESEVEVMQPDLYEGLRLTLEDLMKYDSPLVAFDGSIVMPVGQVTLPVEVEGRKEFVHFIVMHLYSPYMAILGRPQIHSMGGIPTLLRQKVKFSIKQSIVEIRKDQSMAWKCQIAAVGYKQEAEFGSSEPLQQLQPLPYDICEQLERIRINLWDKYFQVGANLPF